MKKYTVSIVFIIIGIILYIYGFQKAKTEGSTGWGIDPARTSKNFGILFIAIGAAISIYKIFKNK